MNELQGAKPMQPHYSEGPLHDRDGEKRKQQDALTWWLLRVSVILAMAVGGTVLGRWL
jgi:hypothetical protein